MRGDYRRDEHLLQLPPSALCAAVSPHLGLASYLPIWNTTPLKVENRGVVGICLLYFVSKPRDLFLLPPPLPLLCLRKISLSLFYSRLCFTLLPAVYCWNTWTSGVSSDTNSSLVSGVKSSTQSSKPAWKAGCISPLRAAAAGQLLVPELSCEVSSGSGGWWYSLQCRPRVAIKWSLLIFYVLSIIQQEKCRSTDRSLRRMRWREWAHMRGCWAGWTCALAIKVVSSSVTDVVCELGLVLTKVWFPKRPLHPLCRSFEVFASISVSPFPACKWSHLSLLSAFSIALRSVILWYDPYTGVDYGFLPDFP